MPTPEQTRQAVDRFQAELTRNAPAIARILDEITADEAAPADAAAPTLTRTDTHCQDCAHPVNVRRAETCVSLGHRVSVVEIKVTTFNSVRALPFVSTPAPYLGSTR